MHTWGDKNVDWIGIGSAADYIGNYCIKWARLGGQTKEKYGTVRFYAQFYPLSLQTLLYPGYHFYQISKWLRPVDEHVIGPVLNFLFGKLFFIWQTHIYRKAYENALKKWPHLREEILCCADHDEYLKGL